MTKLLSVLLFVIYSCLAQAADYSTWAGLTSSTFGAVGCGAPGLPSGHWFNGVAGCCFPTGPTTHNLVINSGHTRSYQTGDGVLNTSGSLTVTGIWNTSINGSIGALTIKNGGVFNITGGTFTVNGTITIEQGGILNVNGGTLLAKAGGNNPVINGTLNIGAGIFTRNAGKMFINYGGLVKITATGGKLNWTGLGTNYTQIEGTFDCQDMLTSSTYSYYALNEVCVPSNSSTGRIRTSNAFTPSTSINLGASNNFFGYNDKYGGTVEYYGSSAISLALGSRYYFYDLEINNSAGVTLYSSCNNVSGNVYLKAGKLVLNSKQINIHGTIIYTGSNYIDPGTGGGKVHFQGKLTSNTSPCINYFSGIITDIPVSGGTKIYSQNAQVDIKNPVLKFSASGGSTIKLAQLKVFRCDIVTLNDNVTIEDGTDPLLSVKVGIIKTGSYVLFFNDVSTTSLEHQTTGFSALSTVGWVSGNLKRRCAAGWSYDFPVGRTDVTDFSADYMKYRRINLENTVISATTNFTVNFNTVFDRPDICSGTLVNASDLGVNYVQLHPEGWWSIVPQVAPATVNYNLYAYIHGFSASPNLVDNRFGALKRQDGSVLCDDWTNGGGTLNASGTSGRIHELSGPLEIGFAQRNGLTSFSEVAIGVTDNDMLPVELLSFNAIANLNKQVDILWETASELNNDFFSIERSTNGMDYFPIVTIEGAGNSNSKKLYSFTDIEPFSGTSFYRLKQTDFDGKSETFLPVSVTIQKKDTFSFVIFPNPAKKVLNLVCEYADENCTFEIIDILGNVIYSQKISPSKVSQKLTIDISLYKKGVYFAKITSNEITSIKKIVLQ